jgi:ankyrin repeat protein
MDLEALCNQAQEGYLIPCRRDDGTLDLHARATNGDTMLHVAVGRRDFDAIRYLLGAGLDVNAQGDYHETPIYSAAAYQDIGLIGFLLQMGADPSIPDHRGTLPAEALFSRLKRLSESSLLRLSERVSAALQDEAIQDQAEQDVTPNA